MPFGGVFFKLFVFLWMGLEDRTNREVFNWKREEGENVTNCHKPPTNTCTPRAYIIWKCTHTSKLYVNIFLHVYTHIDTHAPMQTRAHWHCSTDTHCLCRLWQAEWHIEWHSNAYPSVTPSPSPFPLTLDNVHCIWLGGGAIMKALTRNFKHKVCYTLYTTNRITIYWIRIVKWTVTMFNLWAVRSACTLFILATSQVLQPTHRSFRYLSVAVCWSISLTCHFYCIIVQCVIYIHTQCTLAK